MKVYVYLIIEISSFYNRLISAKTRTSEVVNDLKTAVQNIFNRKAKARGA